MKCVLLFTALVAAWIGASEATTCEDINSCASGMAQFSQIDQSKIEEACDAMRNVLDCFKAGLKDCKEKNPGSQADLNTLEQQMGSVDKMVSQHCGASAVTISITLLFFALLSIFF